MRLLLAAALLTLSASAQPQVSARQPSADPADVATIDGIVAAYYEVVSGPAGQPRDWARDSTLHHPAALILIPGTGADGETTLRSTDLAGFHAQSGGLVEAGFFEHEIARRTERHGAVAHVWSTYEWRQTEDGPVGGQGVNSIQLAHDGSRWWIVSWMFDGRADAPPVPEPYLPE